MPTKPTFSLSLFFAVRLLLTLWAAATVWLLPPADLPGMVPPQQAGLGEGAPRWLLEPWQRFDANIYLRIAREGYAHEEDSVFPPLYPLLVRGLGWLLGGNLAAAALLLANGATLLLLPPLQKLSATEVGERAATRALVYWVLFPTGFFLFAGYTESLFLLWVVGSLLQGQNGRFFPASLLAFLAALTRLNGWLLFFPLALLAWQQGRRNWQTAVFLPLPLLAPALFIAYRAWIGLSSLAAVYAAHWFQRVGVPGQDVVTAVRLLLFGDQITSSRFVLAFNLAVAIGLLVGTWLVWRRFGAVYGVYMATMLLFILLPTSAVKPLYSFSRYALAFFPLFWLLGEWGEKRPFVHRLILYTSFLLFLYFSGQFFLGGWVA